MHLGGRVVEDKLESRCGELFVSVYVVCVREQVVIRVLHFSASLLYLQKKVNHAFPAIKTVLFNLMEV